MADYKQGFFKPTNPKKYIGDPTNIIYRSGWEKRVMEWADTNSGVLRWASEEVVIPYVSPIDNKVHRYFVDFYVEARGRDGETKVMLLEVKPKAQTQEPKKPKRQTKKFINEVMTYGVNKAKWDAATKWARQNGLTFRVITENEMFANGRK